MTTPAVPASTIASSFPIRPSSSILTWCGRLLRTHPSDLTSILLQNAGSLTWMIQSRSHPPIILKTGAGSDVRMKTEYDFLQQLTVVPGIVRPLAHNDDLNVLATEYYHPVPHAQWTAEAFTQALDTLQLAHDILPTSPQVHRPFHHHLSPLPDELVHRGTQWLQQNTRLTDETILATHDALNRLYYADATAGIPSHADTHVENWILQGNKRPILIDFIIPVRHRPGMMRACFSRIYPCTRQPVTAGLPATTLTPLSFSTPVVCLPSR